MAATWCSITAWASWSRRRSDAAGRPAHRGRTGAARSRWSRSRLGQHHPQDGDDQQQIDAGQCDEGAAAEAAGGREHLHRRQPGQHMQHRHRADQHHLQREPFAKGRLQEDQRRAAADGDEGRRRGHHHIDEARDAVQAFQLVDVGHQPALPEQQRQHQQPARPDRDGRQVDELQEGGHDAGAPARRSPDQARRRPTARYGSIAGTHISRPASCWSASGRQAPGGGGLEVQPVQRPRREHDQRAEQAHLPDRGCQREQRGAGRRAGRQHRAPQQPGAGQQRGLHQPVGRHAGQAPGIRPGRMPQPQHDGVEGDQQRQRRRRQARAAGRPAPAAAPPRRSAAHGAAHAPRTAPTTARTAARRRPAPSARSPPSRRAHRRCGRGRPTAPAATSTAEQQRVEVPALPQVRRHRGGAAVGDHSVRQRLHSFALMGRAAPGLAAQNSLSRAVFQSGPVGPWRRLIRPDGADPRPDAACQRAPSWPQAHSTPRQRAAAAAAARAWR